MLDYYLVAKSEVLWGAAPVHAPELRRCGKLRPRSEWIVGYPENGRLFRHAVRPSVLVTRHHVNLNALTPDPLMSASGARARRGLFWDGSPWRRKDEYDNLAR